MFVLASDEGACMLRNNAALHKLVALAVATTVTTSFWVLVLTAGCYVLGIAVSALLLAGCGVAIAAVTALALYSVMDGGAT